MREIKFRGKTHNGRWLYGHYYKVKSFFDEGEASYIRSDHNSSEMVMSDTVGQYTGLHDKNGKEIYEGDIIKVVYQNKLEIFEVRYDEENTCFRMYYEDLKFLDFTIEETDLYEVIGNTIDNPELLKEE